MENPYLNNFCQALEMLTLCDRAIRLLSKLKIRNEALPEIRPRKGTGVAAVEVPRGTLYHEYEFDDTGMIVRSNIITPTTQNLKSIEDDVRAILPQLLPLGEEKIKAELEKLIRAYDPCISCSTHFLKIKWE
jgi:coenzyme F420-reducing hydrogenase alpha subunit